ncbi:MAG TPA: NAD-dependent epimerase/dehydratase family protein, partial [Terriglobales bacterium]|nr:NAD-dependent epimerase/dehydratase family protein [Terriglobales bacterium]
MARPPGCDALAGVYSQNGDSLKDRQTRLRYGAPARTEVAPASRRLSRRHSAAAATLSAHVRPAHNAVTGSFGYTGKYIARELVARGARVRTLTRPHPERPNPFGAQIETAPLDFANFDELVRNLTGVSTLYNTYWVRFSHGRATFDSAVENTKTLIRAARQ